MKTTSTFAATASSRAASEPGSWAARRENFVLRGRTASIVGGACPVRPSATQSPTTGSSAGVAAVRLSFAEIAPLTSSPAARTSYAPRCWTATRPGTSPVVRCRSKAASQASSQPSASSSSTRALSRTTDATSHFVSAGVDSPRSDTSGKGREKHDKPNTALEWARTARASARIRRDRGGGRRLCKQHRELRARRKGDLLRVRRDAAGPYEQVRRPGSHADVCGPPQQGCSGPERPPPGLPTEHRCRLEHARDGHVAERARLDEQHVLPPGRLELQQPHKLRGTDRAGGPHRAGG